MHARLSCPLPPSAHTCRHCDHAVFTPQPRHLPPPGRTPHLGSKPLLCCLPPSPRRQPLFRRPLSAALFFHRSRGPLSTRWRDHGKERPHLCDRPGPCRVCQDPRQGQGRLRHIPPPRCARLFRPLPLPPFTHRQLDEPSSSIPTSPLSIRPSLRRACSSPSFPPLHQAPSFRRVPPPAVSPGLGAPPQTLLPPLPPACCEG